VAQGEGPKFKPQYHKKGRKRRRRRRKKKNKKNKNKKKEEEEEKSKQAVLTQNDGKSHQCLSSWPF
jgi:hypothetical protein